VGGARPTSDDPAQGWLVPSTQQIEEEEEVMLAADRQGAVDERRQRVQRGRGGWHPHLARAQAALASASPWQGPGQ
jgi:hypothetical protein